MESNGHSNNNKDGKEAIVEIARQAVHDYPTSDIEVGINFCESVCPTFLEQSCDRLVKVGRSVRSLIELCDQDSMISIVSLCESLQLIQEECEVLLLLQTGKIEVKVPKVSFGRTGKFCL
jgi:hypothetical protein